MFIDIINQINNAIFASNKNNNGDSKEPCKDILKSRKRNDFEAQYSAPQPSFDFFTSILNICSGNERKEPKTKTPAKPIDEEGSRYMYAGVEYVPVKIPRTIPVNESAYYF